MPTVATVGAGPGIARMPQVGTPPSHLAARFTDRNHRVAIIGASAWTHYDLLPTKVQRVSQIL